MKHILTPSGRAPKTFPRLIRRAFAQGVSDHELFVFVGTRSTVFNIMLQVMIVTTATSATGTTNPQQKLKAARTVLQNGCNSPKGLQQLLQSLFLV
jgi:hypothetical protein